MWLSTEERGRGCRRRRRQDGGHMQAEVGRWASVGRGECEHRLDGGGVRKGAVGWMAEDLGGRGVWRLYYRLF